MMKEKVCKILRIGSFALSAILFVWGLIAKNELLVGLSLLLLTIVAISYVDGKNDLFKITGLMVLLAAVLTWLIPIGYFSNGKLEVQEITRVGIMDFLTIGIDTIKYFPTIIVFMLILFGFYQLLSKIPAYQNMTATIAKKLKGKEIIFSIVTSFVVAVITGFVSNSINSALTGCFVALTFLPFIITICSKMKLDKISTFATTFGGFLIGIMGSLFSTNLVGLNVSAFGLAYNKGILIRAILFALTFVVFNVFNVLHMRKALKDKKAEQTEDIFANEITEKNSKSSIPLIIVLAITAIVIILGYIAWGTIFEHTWPTDALTWIKEVTILDHNIFSYILGNVTAFGTWDISNISIILLIATLIIKVIYSINLDDVLKSFGEGFKKSGKVIIITLLVYMVLVISVMYPVLPTISNWIVELTDSFNVFTAYIVSLLNALFGVEYQYVISLVGTHLAALYADNLTVLSVIMQSAYGLISFVAPTSAVLLIGLSYLDIKYKSWLKYIWKFLLAMLVVTIVMALIIA